VAESYGGAKAVNLLQKLSDADLNAVKFYWVTRGTVCQLREILIARTGYTAEDGFEIYIPSDEVTSARVWNEIRAAGKEFVAIACGLGPSGVSLEESLNTLAAPGALLLPGT